MKSLSVRAFAIIVPVVLVFFGVSTWLAYDAAREREIASSMQVVTQDRVLAQQALQQRFDAIARAHERSRKRMLDQLETGEQASPTFDRVFAPAGDGTRRSVDNLWEGQSLAIGRVEGFGAFISDEQLGSERKRRLWAAFASLANFVDGLPEDVNNIYFFSPENDLIMHAPTRADRLIFYRREAPADLDFQEEEFSQIVFPEANPEGQMKCTSLQPILYDETRQTWTTGCMTPVRLQGEHIGAFGSSLPLDEIFRDDDLVANEDVTRVVITSEGKLIRHPEFTVQSSARTGEFLDLATTDDPRLRELWTALSGIGDEGFDGYVPGADIYLDARKLDRPEWYVASFVPGADIRASAFSSSQPILLSGLVATFMFALLVSFLSRKFLTRPIEKLAERADRISSRQDLSIGRKAPEGDELARLDFAFDALELRVSEERARLTRSFDRLVDAIEEYAILLLDPTGAVVRANGAATDTFHWLEGLTLSQVMPRSQDQSGEILRRVEEDGRVSQSVERVKGDGTTFWAFEAIEPIVDGEENIAGFAYIARDITSQKEAEAEIVAARDKARAELAARTNILAVVSHEIRTPLGGILGIIDQLKRERSEQEREKALRLIEDSAEVLLDTLDAILQQARIGQDSDNLDEKRFNPTSVAQRVAELFRPLARRKGLRIEASGPSDAYAIGDPARIQQVIANLVSNAVKFTQSGSVKIDVARPKEQGDTWTFTVTDTGAGMDEKRVATIFKPFGESSTDSLGRSVGAGLGLSITRDLVEAIGGRIEVTSKPGRGSSFSVHLPLAEAGPAGEHPNGEALGGTIVICVEKASERVQVEAVASSFGFETRACGVADLPSHEARLYVIDEGAQEALAGSDWAPEAPVALVTSSPHELPSAASAQFIPVSSNQIARSLHDLLERGIDGNT